MFKVGDVVECISENGDVLLGHTYIIQDTYREMSTEFVKIIREKDDQIVGVYAKRFKLVGENKMIDANSKKWGPWIKFTGQTKPDDLDDYDRIQAVYVNTLGELRNEFEENRDRSARGHNWYDNGVATTLAYRVEQKVTNHVMYGRIAGQWNDYKAVEDTHKITYEMLGQEVKSCVMEKL